MQYVRFTCKNGAFWGVKDGDTVRELSKPPYDGVSYSGETYPLSDVTLLAPCEPTKIVCVGKNYYDHIMEFHDKAEVPKNPILFLKPTTCVNDPDGVIVYPDRSARVDHESELAFVVKKTAKHVAAADAYDYILGYTCLNDVTARDIQRADGQWTRGKCFDGFAPIGPVVTDEVDPSDLKVECRINGETRQSGRTSQFIWDIPTLVEFITASMTLLPGDVVTTGTPAGISGMAKGDVCEVEVEGIGVLRSFIR